LFSIRESETWGRGWISLVISFGFTCLYFLFFAAESFVGKGRYVKKIRIHARGRFGIEKKKYCHYFLVLKEGTGKEKNVKRRLKHMNELEEIQRHPRHIVNSLAWWWNQCFPISHFHISTTRALTFHFFPRFQFPIYMLGLFLNWLHGARFTSELIGWLSNRTRTSHEDGGMLSSLDSVPIWPYLGIFTASTDVSACLRNQPDGHGTSTPGCRLCEHRVSVKKQPLVGWSRTRNSRDSYITKFRVAQRMTWNKVKNVYFIHGLCG